MEHIKAIGYILRNDAGVTAIASTRSYHLNAPQRAAFPFVVFNTVSVNPYDTKSGASDLDQVRIQVDSYAADNSTAANLNSAVRAALDRYPHGAVNGVTLDGVQYITTADFTEDNTSADGGGLIYHFASDFYVRVKY